MHVVEVGCALQLLHGLDDVHRNQDWHCDAHQRMEHGDARLGLPWCVWSRVCRPAFGHTAWTNSAALQLSRHARSLAAVLAQNCRSQRNRRVSANVVLFFE